MRFDHSPKSDVLVVLVNWRRAADTILCIESLSLNSQDKIVVSVCDNSSGDGSGEKIRSKLSSYGVEEKLRGWWEKKEVFEYFDADGRLRAVFVQNDVNAGFAGGNNLAYAAATRVGDYAYTWFLNNDTEIDSGCIPALFERMNGDETIGICGVTLVYAYDRKTVQALGGARYTPWTGLLTEVGQGTTWPHLVDERSIERSLDYVSGASMFVSEAFLKKVGLMSEDYFLYFEELDWAMRARRAGFRLAYASNAIVYHKEGAALGSGKSQRRSALAEFYALRNRLRITRKFFPLALPSVFFFAWLQVIRRLMQGHFSRARMMMAVLLGLRKEAP